MRPHALCQQLWNEPNMQGRISLFDKFVFLPLFHNTCGGEGRGEEVRFARSVPLSLFLSPLGGARGRNPMISNEFSRK
jgi:hypothetical protein